ncbi:hypothetical protein BH11MYX1_BH11MYX1_30780 [soil metagenome]
MRIMPLLLLAFAACGASSAELRTARTTVYTTDGGQLLSLAQQAAADKHYKLGAVDDGHLMFETQPTFYSAEGDLQTPGADNYTLVRNNSVQVSFIVELQALADREFAVRVTPHTYQYLAGSPQMRPLEPEDPNLPPWIHGRADALQVAIYDRAKNFAR